MPLQGKDSLGSGLVKRPLLFGRMLACLMPLHQLNKHTVLAHAAKIQIWGAQQEQAPWAEGWPLTTSTSHSARTIMHTLSRRSLKCLQSQLLIWSVACLFSSTVMLGKEEE